jgi:hypothetical protein
VAFELPEVVPSRTIPENNSWLLRAFSPGWRSIQEIKHVMRRAGSGVPEGVPERIRSRLSRSRARRRAENGSMAEASRTEPAHRPSPRADRFSEITAVVFGFAWP